MSRGGGGDSAAVVVKHGHVVKLKNEHAEMLKQHVAERSNKSKLTKHVFHKFKHETKRKHVQWNKPWQQTLQKCSAHPLLLNVRAARNADKDNAVLINCVLQCPNKVLQLT